MAKKYVLCSLISAEGNYPKTMTFIDALSAKEYILPKFKQFVEENQLNINVAYNYLYNEPYINIENETTFNFDQEGNFLQIYSSGDLGTFYANLIETDEDQNYVFCESNGIEIYDIEFYQTFLEGFEHRIIPYFNVEDGLDDKVIAEVKQGHKVDLIQDFEDCFVTLNVDENNGYFEGGNQYKDIDMILAKI